MTRIDVTVGEVSVSVHSPSGGIERVTGVARDLLALALAGRRPDPPHRPVGFESGPVMFNAELMPGDPPLRHTTDPQARTRKADPA